MNAMKAEPTVRKAFSKVLRGMWPGYVGERCNGELVWNARDVGMVRVWRFWMAFQVIGRMQNLTLTAPAMDSIRTVAA